MSAWKVAATVLAGTAGVVLALLLAGRSGGLALLAYVLFLAAVALAVLAVRIRDEVPAATRLERLLAVTARRPEPVRQLETIRRELAAAGRSQGELHYRLGPVVREIAAARLSRSQGVDLDRQPERAQALIGAGRVWELARPGRERPDNLRSGGWSRRELAALLDELERI